MGDIASPRGLLAGEFDTWRPGLVGTRRINFDPMSRLIGSLFWVDSSPSRRSLDAMPSPRHVSSLRLPRGVLVFDLFLMAAFHVFRVGGSHLGGRLRLAPFAA